MVRSRWRNRRGTSTRGCLVTLLFLAVVLYYGINIGEVFYRRSQLQEEMSSLPALDVMLPNLDIVAEYVLFWLSLELRDLVKSGQAGAMRDSAGNPYVLIKDIQAPIWGDPREAVRIIVEVFGNAESLIVPFTKAR